MPALPEPMDTSPCSTCAGAGCCFAYRVAVSPADVHRMYRGTGASPLAFAFLLPRGDGGDGIRLGRDGAGHELCLQKRLGEGGANPCVWLTGEHGSYRCRAHVYRPMACRSFPLRPSAEGWRPLGDPCPPGAWHQEHVHQEAARRLHALWSVERDLGRAFVDRWNAIADQAEPGRSLTPGMFFYWVIAVFDRLSLVFSRFTESDAALDAFLARWDEHGMAEASWGAEVREALALVDGALLR